MNKIFYCLLLFVLFSCVSSTHQSKAPVRVGVSPMNEATIQSFEDGRLEIYHAPQRFSDSVMCMKSFDEGLTWEKSEVVLRDSTIGQYPRRTLIDRDGNIHLLVFNVKNNLSVNHTMSRDEGKTWQPLKQIAHGWIGAIRGFIQTESGRLVFGFHRRSGDKVAPYGSHYSSFVYSDDNGKTWTESVSKIVSPVYDDYNGNNFGAVEPTIVEYEKGKLWALIRTQTGRLYSSYSMDNGTTWSEGKPSQFHSSNSPASLYKLKDGRIILTWCNNVDTDIKTFGKIYTHRDVLHMAISDDNGKSWKGFREVYRILSRNDQNDLPAHGDTGTAYPNVVQTKSGDLVIVTGQGEYGDGRSIIKVDIDWLYDKEAKIDFAKGLDETTAYTFTVLGTKPKRMLGPALLDDSRAKGGKVAHVRKINRDTLGDGLVWNFPSARDGEIKMRVKTPKNSKHSWISLTDHHHHPSDKDGESTALYTFSSSDFKSNQWVDVSLKWNLDKASCQLYINDDKIGDISLKNNSETGVSYIRFRSKAEGETIDNEGIYIDYIEMKKND